MKSKKTDRFSVKYYQKTFLGKIQIILDNETGVNYIITSGTGFSGITPLLNKDGFVFADK